MYTFHPPFVFMISIFLCVPSVWYMGPCTRVVSLTPDKSIESESGCEIYQWAGICTDSKGTLYLTDIMDHSVKKITREGILIKKIDKKGQKSGEFIRPHLIQYYNDSLYISDQNKNGIQVFDIKLNYAYTIPCRYPVLDMHIMASNQILISWFDPLQKASLVLVDNLGKVMSHILLEEISRHSIMNAASFVVTRNSEIIIAYKYQDCICKINTNGGILWKKSLLKDIKTETKSILGFTLPEKIVYSDVAIDTTGNVFVLGGGYSAHGKRQVYVLSPNGDFLNDCFLDEPSHTIHIDICNRIYVRGGMGTKIKRYRILYE